MILKQMAITKELSPTKSDYLNENINKLPLIVFLDKKDLNNLIKHSVEYISENFNYLITNRSIYKMTGWCVKDSVIHYCLECYRYDEKSYNKAEKLAQKQIIKLINITENKNY